MNSIQPKTTIMSSMLPKNTALSKLGLSPDQMKSITEGESYKNRSMRLMGVSAFLLLAGLISVIVLLQTNNRKEKADCPPAASKGVMVFVAIVNTLLALYIMYDAYTMFKAGDKNNAAIMMVLAVMVLFGAIGNWIFFAKLKTNDETECIPESFLTMCKVSTSVSLLAGGAFVLFDFTLLKRAESSLSKMLSTPS